VDGALDDLLFVGVEVAGEVLVEGGLFLLEDCLMLASGRGRGSVVLTEKSMLEHAVGFDLVQWCLEETLFF
jgi:hypothetical protein